MTRDGTSWIKGLESGVLLARKLTVKERLSVCIHQYVYLFDELTIISYFSALALVSLRSERDFCSDVNKNVYF